MVKQISKLIIIVISLISINFSTSIARTDYHLAEIIKMSDLIIIGEKTKFHYEFSPNWKHTIKVYKTLKGRSKRDVKVKYSRYLRGFSAIDPQKSEHKKGIFYLTKSGTPFIYNVFYYQETKGNFAYVCRDGLPIYPKSFNKYYQEVVKISDTTSRSINLIKIEDLEGLIHEEPNRLKQNCDIIPRYFFLGKHRNIDKLRRMNIELTSDDSLFVFKRLFRKGQNAELVKIFLEDPSRIKELDEGKALWRYRSFLQKADFIINDGKVIEYISPRRIVY